MLKLSVEPTPKLLGACTLLAGLLILSRSSFAEPTRQVDLTALFAAAEREGRVGLAHKTKIVDVRTARLGEIIVTVIKDEGKETQSPPAEAGDFVVRNRCPKTGNEQFLVKAAKFRERYDGPIGHADQDGWQSFRPRGIQMLYFIVRPIDGSFIFTAPWGEAMVAQPKDAIVRNPTNAKDMYRIAAAAFDCTYEIPNRPLKK
jgi:hypothetical protein